MGDQEIVVDTVKAFLEDTPQALKNMKQQFADQNWEKLAAQAHKIKPNLEYMGMTEARELIQEIEEQAKGQSKSEELGNQIDQFCAICSTGLEELSNKVEELETSEG